MLDGANPHHGRPEEDDVNSGKDPELDIADEGVLPSHFATMGQHPVTSKKVKFNKEALKRAKHRELHPSKYQSYNFGKSPRSSSAPLYKDLPLAREIIEAEEENRRKKAWKLNKELFPRKVDYAKEKDTFFTNGKHS